jgi:hypothetical protein
MPDRRRRPAFPEGKVIPDRSLVLGHRRQEIK